MTDQKKPKGSVVLARRRFALGLIATLIVVAVPTMSRGEEIFYRRRRRRRYRRRHCSYRRRRC